MEHSAALKIMIERKKLLRGLRDISRRDDPEGYDRIKARASEMRREARRAGKLTLEERHALALVH